ncbi:hypothetical protein TNCV_3719101 [Trichonephila clavipes]|nr:hypothetical protein TNCV_3719101 [Trichonephila clavipes]
MACQIEEKCLQNSCLDFIQLNFNFLQRFRSLAVILAPDEGGVETNWISAGATDAGKAIGSAVAQMLVKLLELERLLELDHVSALVSLSVGSQFQSRFLSDPEDIPEFQEEMCHNMIEYDDDQSLEQDEMSETECDRDCSGVTRQRKYISGSYSRVGAIIAC